MRLILSILTLAAATVAVQAQPKFPSVNDFLPLNPGEQTTNVTLACNAYSNAYETLVAMRVSVGTRSSNYFAAHLYPATNIFTVSNLDVTTPYFFTVQAVCSNSVPTIKTRTNTVIDAETGEKVVTVTTCSNYLQLSPRSGECSFATSNTVPWLQQCGSGLSLNWFAQSNMIYMVTSGPDIGSMTNAVCSLIGSNAPVFTTNTGWTAEAAPRFFSVKYSNITN
jgi:hypothetical protein